MSLLNSPVTGCLTLVYNGTAPSTREGRTDTIPQLISLRGNKMSLGRAISNQIAINSLQISRKHCIFEYKHLKWWIQDFSTNGIIVNNDKAGREKLVPLQENDRVQLIPSGLLIYKFSYQPPVPPLILLSPPRLPTRELTPSPLNPLPLFDIEIVGAEDGSESDASESLLSIEDSTRPNSQLLKRSKSECGIEESSKRRKNVVDEEEEDLLDLDDEGSGEFLSSLNKIETCQESEIKGKVEGEVEKIDESEKSVGTVSSFPRLKTREEESEEIRELRASLAFYIEKCRTSEARMKLSQLEAATEREKMRKELQESHSVLLCQKTEIYKEVMGIVENEFNCCVCNDVFIQATVVDCGHTFCSHCINEWLKKQFQKECPICRSPVTKCSKHIELENFIGRVISLMPHEIQFRRSEAVSERADEVAAASKPPPVVNSNNRGGGINLAQFEEMLADDFQLLQWDQLFDLQLGGPFEPPARRGLNPPVRRPARGRRGGGGQVGTRVVGISSGVGTSSGTSSNVRPNSSRRGRGSRNVSMSTRSHGSSSPTPPNQESGIVNDLVQLTPPPTSTRQPTSRLRSAVGSIYDLITGTGQNQL